MAPVALDLTDQRTHYSGLGLFRKCPQAWSYRYMWGLRSQRDTVTPEMALGSWWSALRGAEALERGRRLGSLLEVSPNPEWQPVSGWHAFDQRTVTVADIHLEAVAWWNHIDDEFQAAFRKVFDDESLPDRLFALEVSWRDRWAGEILRERPLAVEMQWKRVLTRPASDSDWDADPALAGLTVSLFGTLDEIYFDTERQMTVLRDQKTAKTLSAATSSSDMMESQLPLYVWGAQPEITRLGGGTIRSIGYDRIKSGRPTTPKLTKGGALSKAVTQFDLETYRRWVTEGQQYGPPDDNGIQATYEEEPEVVARLTALAHRSLFHQRTLVPVSPKMVKAHLRAAMDSAVEMARTRARYHHTGQAARSFGWNCRQCPFQALCLAQLIGGVDGEYPVDQYGLQSDYGYDVLTHPQPEPPAEETQTETPS